MSEEQPQDGDPAEAFERLRGEVALMRRAVEGMATERATIDAPDYSETLGRMVHNITAVAQRVDILAKSPALAMTPEQMTARINAAGSDARRSDQQIIAEARSDDFRIVKRSPPRRVRKSHVSRHRPAPDIA